MRIGIDLRPLQDGSRFRGIGRVLENIIVNIDPILKQDDELIFYYSSSDIFPEIARKFSRYKIIPLKKPLLGRIRYIRAVARTETHVNPSPDEVDVFLQVDAKYGVPTSVPCVTFFYDIIPTLFREEELSKTHTTGLLGLKAKLSNYLFWRKYKNNLSLYANSAKILAISKSSKDDLLQHVDSIRSSMVSVVYLGVNNSIAKPQKENIDYLKSVGVNSKKYLLYVGGIDYRKNISQLLSSYFNIRKSFKDIDIVFVGKEFSLQAQLENIGWNSVLRENKDYIDSVKITGYVNDDELYTLYKNALAFVFPSRYEGFGLPILEAMQQGCPVVAYDNSSIPEVAGKAALLVPDQESMEPAIKRLIEQPRLRDKLVHSGYDRYKLFTWEKTAKQVYDSLKESSGA